jgi:hypothetical protein
MTVALAWVGKRRDGLEHLYMASDSRLTGARSDASPKILVLPRSDCALCFAGDTHATYPLMLQLANAIAAHQPARERSLDVSRVKDHLLRLFKDLVRRYEISFEKADIQFIFAGYSWRSKDFRIWAIGYDPKKKEFLQREGRSFTQRLNKVAFIGDWSKQLRAALAKNLSGPGPPVYIEPLKSLAGFLERAEPAHSIGGPPQLIRISQHMTTRARFASSGRGRTRSSGARSSTMRTPTTGSSTRSRASSSCPGSSAIVRLSRRMKSS